jgi:bifunctional non-homologous end joining protein LigD
LLRPLLKERGLEPVAKTSGGKGMQLTTALSGHTSEQASELARGLAEQLEREHRGLIVSRMIKAIRPGKVLIDWSQNNAKKTTVAPYSLRAMAEPTVSTPLTWDEVSSCERAQDLVFTSEDVLDRVERLGDLQAPLLG